MSLTRPKEQLRLLRWTTSSAVDCAMHLRRRKLAASLLPRQSLKGCRQRPSDSLLVRRPRTQPASAPEAPQEVLPRPERKERRHRNGTVFVDPGNERYEVFLELFKDSAYAKRKCSDKLARLTRAITWSNARSQGNWVEASLALLRRHEHAGSLVNQIAPQLASMPAVQGPDQCARLLSALESFWHEALSLQSENSPFGPAAREAAQHFI